MEEVTVVTVTPASLNSTFGVLFVGFILAVTLYGLTFFQTYVFYSRFPNDNLRIKCVVGLLWAIDTVTTAMISHMQYYYLITSFLISWERLPVTNSFAIEKGLSTLAILTVQWCYATRIYSVTGKNVLASGAVAFLAFAVFVLGITASVQIVHRNLISALITPSMKVTIGLNEGLATTCDLLIALTLFCCLRAVRYPQIRCPTDTFERVMRFAVNRGTLFTVAQFILLLSFLASPNSQVWILFHFIISKIHVNSLLCLLNSRKASRGRGIHEEDDVVEDKHAKAALAIPSARDMRVSSLDLGAAWKLEQCGNVMSIELGPVSPRSDTTDVTRAKSSISMDSDTLRGGITPISMRAPSFDTLKEHIGGP